MPRAKAFQVYRLLNASGELLYAGCSCDAARRMLEHHTKDWFNEVTSATFEHFETAEQASDAGADSYPDRGPEVQRACRLLCQDGE
jgi:predicted GIY-YIG superfamily endonuclease